jgi:hypothetical protein
VVLLEKQVKIFEAVIREYLIDKIKKEGVQTLDEQHIKTDIGRFAAKYNFLPQEVLETFRSAIKAFMEEMQEANKKRIYDLNNTSFLKG